MASNTQTIYLEQWVESAYFLPTELSRLLSTIKSLDDRCAELTEALQTATAQLLSMPPAYQAPPTQQYTTLMKKVAADQKMLTQFSEEKVQLAQQAYDLLEVHALDLERTMENFESDMNVMGEGGDIVGGLTLAGIDTAIAQAQDMLTNPTGAAAGYDPVQSRARTPRLEDWNVPTPPEAYTSLPLPLAPGLPPPPTQPTPIQKRTQVARMSSHQKRVKSEEAPLPPSQQTLAPPPPPVPGSGQQPGHASGSHGPHSNGAHGAGQGNPTLHRFMRPPAPGLQASARAPQVPGRVLAAADIGPGLRGRHAELYWPDDMSWYLIEIQDVDPVTKKARIVYTTGEEEELALEEIARDRHMTLIPPELYGAPPAP